MSHRLSYKEFANIIYDEVVNNVTLYEELKQPVKQHIEVGGKYLEWECFYLWTFLVTYNLQRKFSYLGDKQVKQILDILHQRIYSLKEKPYFPIEDLITIRNKMTIRYNQYYKVIREDWEVLGKPDCLPFFSLTQLFTENLVNNKIDGFKDFRVFRMFFGMYIGELCKLLFDIFEKIKKKYEISFDTITNE